MSNFWYTLRILMNISIITECKTFFLNTRISCYYITDICFTILVLYNLCSQEINAYSFYSGKVLRTGCIFHKNVLFLLRRLYGYVIL